MPFDVPVVDDEVVITYDPDDQEDCQLPVGRNHDVRSDRPNVYPFTECPNHDSYRWHDCGCSFRPRGGRASSS